MIRIKLSTNSDWPLVRQAPGSKGQWGDCLFFIDEELPECDWWVVYEALATTESTRCPPENTLFIGGEPPSIRTYEPAFLKQFGCILTCQPISCRGRVLRSQQALPWHVGVRRKPDGHNEVRFNYDDFLSQDVTSKRKELSIICSSKDMTEVHRQRIRFAMHLKAHFGERADSFGRGFQEIGDKWDGIEPYRYHVAIENDRVADYFTEKLTDAFLAGSFPFYYGCPNILDYFPESSLTPIDIYDPEGAIAVIESVIQARTYERHIDCLAEAHSLVLDRYNLFPTIAEICQSRARSDAPVISIKPESDFKTNSSGRNSLVQVGLSIARQLGRWPKGKRNQY